MKGLLNSQLIYRLVLEKESPLLEVLANLPEGDSLDVAPLYAWRRLCGPLVPRIPQPGGPGHTTGGDLGLD